MNDSTTKNIYTIPVDADMLEAIASAGENAQVDLTSTTAYFDPSSIDFMTLLRRNYILDRLQLRLESSTPRDVQEFYTKQTILDGQVALLTYLIEINSFNRSTED